MESNIMLGISALPVSCITTNTRDVFKIQMEYTNLVSAVYDKLCLFH